jgi:tripartite-type tricarboxylate transporter receptor subunit TctC
MSAIRTFSRRQVIASMAASASAGWAAVGPALGQDYPRGPLQILVAYGAGGGTDTLARLLAVPLSKILGHPVTVQNLPGGGGQVAATTLLRDGGDGHAILATNEPDLFMSTVFSKPPYAHTDFQVIMADVLDPRILLVQKESDIGSLADFVDRAKAQPGKLTVSVTQGGAQELFAKWFVGKLGLNIRIVGYNGGAAAANAMLAGDVVATVGDDSARMNIRDKSKALLIGAQEKSPRWPEAPTLTAALTKYGVSAPSGGFLSRYGVYVVPSALKSKAPAAYAKLQQALIQAHDTPEFQGYIVKNTLQDLSMGKPGEALDATFAADFAEIAKLK